MMMNMKNVENNNGRNECVRLAVVQKIGALWGSTMGERYGGALWRSTMEEHYGGVFRRLV